MSRIARSRPWSLLGSVPAGGLMLLVWPLAACDSEPATPCTTSAWYADADGDGFGAGSAVSACQAPTDHVATAGDCDDTDPQVFPGATEQCNGWDDDCDGVTDPDDAVDVQDCYRDADGDGFGSADQHYSACSCNNGYVLVATDCDDGDATVSPGAAETWYDGVDQDCDGATDDDADGDGYAWDGLGGPDCDDLDAGVHPGAEDVCGDALDADCGGDPDGCRRTGAMRLADAEVLISDTVQGTLGVELEAESRCLDRDPGSLWVGAPGTGEFDPVRTRAWLLDLSAAGDATAEERSLARVEGTHMDDYTGYGLSTADVDGDGLCDVLVGSLGQRRGVDAVGEVGVFYGPFDFEVTMDQADLSWMGVDPSGTFGYQTAVVQSQTGDPMVVVSAISSDTLEGESWQGRVLFFDPESSGGTADDAMSSILGMTGWGYLGVELRADDLNGDGLEEMVFHVAREDRVVGTADASVSVVGVFEGPFAEGATWTLADADRIWSRGLLDFFGHVIALGPDLDEDGIQDVFVSAPATGESTEDPAAFVLSGTTPTSTSGVDALASFVSDDEDTLFGYGFAPVGDFDGDGSLDVAVGDPDLGDPSLGGVSLFYGPLAGTMEQAHADLSLYGESYYDHAGMELRGGDFDSDGFADLVVSAPGRPSNTFYGGIYIVRGGVDADLSL